MEEQELIAWETVDACGPAVGKNNFSHSIKRSAAFGHWIGPVCLFPLLNGKKVNGFFVWLQSKPQQSWKLVLNCQRRHSFVRSLSSQWMFGLLLLALVLEWGHLVVGFRVIFTRKGKGTCICQKRPQGKPQRGGVSLLQWKERPKTQCEVVTLKPYRFASRISCVTCWPIGWKDRMK